MHNIILKVKMHADLSSKGCVKSQIVEIEMTRNDYNDIQEMEKIINSTFKKWVFKKVCSSSYWEIVE